MAVSLKKLSCPNCGAPLHLGPTDTMVQCKYCHQSIEVQRSAPPRGGPTGQNVVYVPEQGVDFGWWPLIILFAGMAVVAALVFAAIKVFDLGQPKPRLQTPMTLPTLGEHLQWHAIGPVFPGHVNDDATEDVVGPYRLLQGTMTPVFVGAFDGATRQRLWSAGPFVSGEDMQHLHVGRAGARVLVSDAKATVHLLDLASGKALAAPKLSDRVKRICGAPDAPARFYVETADEQGVMVDATGAVSRAPAPDFCPSRKTVGFDDCQLLPLFGGPTLPCLPLQHAPRVEGLDPKWAIGDAHDAVLIGQRQPGTAVPLAAGYDPKTRKVRWSRAIPTVDPLSVREGPPEVVALADGVLYAYYGRTQALARLAAIDVRTGETRWEVDVPNSDQGSGPRLMTVGAEHVYVPHWTWLEVHARKTGRHLGTIGRW